MHPFCAQNIVHKRRTSLYGLKRIVAIKRDTMLFCCPQCKREEEIILDRDPRCMKCHVEMIPPSDYSQVCMSPYTAIVRMNTISETYGIDRARTDGRFKKEREAWATGVLALALTKLKDDVWWVEVETVDNTPDTRLWQIDETPNGNVVNTRNIENVDWEKNVDDVMMVITKKCKRAYPSDYLLVVHARNYGKEINFDRVIEQMKSLQSPFLEVWVIAVVGRDDIKVVRVSPGLPVVDLKIRAELEKASKQVPFVKRGSRGLEPGFYSAGTVFLPLPRCD